MYAVSVSTRAVTVNTTNVLLSSLLFRFLLPVTTGAFPKTYAALSGCKIIYNLPYVVPVWSVHTRTRYYYCVTCAHGNNIITFAFPPPVRPISETVIAKTHDRRLRVVLSRASPTHITPLRALHATAPRKTRVNISSGEPIIKGRGTERKTRRGEPIKLGDSRHPRCLRDVFPRSLFRPASLFRPLKSRYIYFIQN